ncbi:MAG TPA: ShlB/FhaC/HecB family hemolysin secretion/activation protein [Gemmatimonadaceae bacterium]|nr:ShlB/FhaC/HecB family hemolysin secretion/activation protein [Gemmatimonadaceae bacterium]
MLFSALPLIAALQIAVPARPQASTTAADTSTIDSAHTRSRSAKKGRGLKHELIPLTPELRASAYRDALARDLIARAREARLRQDSSLLSYDATTKQRISAWLGVRKLGARRLAYRSENASRVRWQRGVGAWVDVIGARTAIPMAFEGARVVEGALDESPIPYYPGREGLLSLAGVETVSGDEEGIFMHPLEEGAESYYRYASGDSVRFTLPDGRVVRLREVRIAARKPRWDLLVGSLWFDVASAHLVRAVFRPSAPFDIMQFLKREEPDDYDDIPRAVRAIMSPATITIDAFTVEYGLHEQRWWLPRLQTVEARGQMGFMRMPFSMQQSFSYASVSGKDSLALPRIPLPPEDSTRGQRNECALGDTLIRARTMFDKQLRVAYRIPCDTVALAHSSELPPSIFDPGEEVFGTEQGRELAKELDPSLQPGWGPLPYTLHYGLDRGMLRYNRVEGLSAGIDVERQLGRGYSSEASVRLGVADLSPNGELHVRRSRGSVAYGLGVYRRLDAANDWGEPLGVGASLDALLFARDDGFYYRSWGAEMTRASQRGARSQLVQRIFVERQSGASVNTQFSLANAISDTRFLENIAAEKATTIGYEASLSGSYGDDPAGWRATTLLRAELGTGTFDYTRGSAEATVSHAVGSKLVGALTASAGASGGTLPVQRLWYLGGPYTVHGQGPGTAVGDAYWFGRAELGWGTSKLRPIIFGDIGWAGDRHDWRSPGRPISGAGVGASVLDGLIRLDLSRGIRPDRGWRADMYLQGTF